MGDVIRHIIVRGRVQGVGYRAWFEDEAVARDLAGWARNRRDGTVEAVLSGSEDAVAALIAKCQHGPGMARVTTIDNEPATEDMLNLRASGERFSVLPTI
ncbi:acylphosphatase [Afipia massiliensis]|uniref:acylphosphatase n=1 Tax=Afipia massiliensis TaxID=211460 RepID=A0A840N4H5_9BRAD|nr:acylphosphatase [Afipia massiliensis]MBB5051636.1 acylphosphatase [Afipia massiliensis]